jgi:hypothetical protein
MGPGYGMPPGVQAAENHLVKRQMARMLRDAGGNMRSTP